MHEKNKQTKELLWNADRISHEVEGKENSSAWGTSGIGFATAEMAARGNAAIVVVSSRRENVDRAVARLPKGTEGYAIDLSNEEQVRDFFNQIGAFDHLVFTAGERVQFGELSETTVEQASNWLPYVSMRSALDPSESSYG